MDSLICSAHLLWWEKMSIFVGVGLIILLPFYLVPSWALRWVGKKGLSPNIVTLSRIPISYLGYYVYFCCLPFWGYCICVFSCGCDALDGRLARALGNLNPDKKGIGKWLDPLADKCTLPVFMAVMAWRGHLSWPILIPMIVVEFGGQALRLGFVRPLVRGLGSKALGKLKYAAQAICLLVCLPYDQHWIRQGVSVPDWMLALALAGALLSVMSRLKIQPRFDALLDRLNDSLLNLIPGQRA